MIEEFNIQGKQTFFYKYCPGTFGYTLVYKPTYTAVLVRTQGRLTSDLPERNYSVSRGVSVQVIVKGPLK